MLISHRSTSQVGELLIEYVGTSLDAYLESRGNNSQTNNTFIYNMAMQMVDNLKVLHQLGYLHNDIKLGNICMVNA